MKRLIVCLPLLSGCSITPFSFQAEQAEMLTIADKIHNEVADMLVMLRDLEARPGCPGTTAPRHR